MPSLRASGPLCRCLSAAGWMLLTLLAQPAVNAQRRAEDQPASRVAVATVGRRDPQPNRDPLPDTLESKSVAPETRAGVRSVASSLAAPRVRTAARRPRPVEDDPEDRPLRKYHTPGTEPAPEGGGNLFLSVLGKLAFVVALMLACAAGWRRFQNVMPQNTALAATGVQIISTTPLGAQRCLQVVAVGRRQLLIGSTPHSITLLATLDDVGAATATGNNLSAGRQASSDHAAGRVGDWDESPAAEDRFEELVLRLRRLEAGQAQAETPRAPVRTADRRTALAEGPSAGELFAGGGAQARTSDPSPRTEASAAGIGHVPGALFRTSANTARAERHA